MHRFRQPQSYNERTPTGGAGVRGGGGGRPGRGDVRRGGPTAVELCPQSYSRCLPTHIAWATRCDRLLAVLIPLDRCRVPSRLRIRNIAHHSDLATIRGPNVSAVASWDTHKFAAPSRTLPSHSDRTGGSTGQTDHSDVMEDPHRETKYRPGPDPHWPVCHRFGPRFIINRHPRYSPGKFICLHTPWGINH